MSQKIPIAIAHGDGIGPEIMDATLRILEAAKAPFEYHEVKIEGEQTSLNKETLETIRTSQAFLKAPLTTHQSGDFKSLSMTLRTSLGLYANVRPSVSYSPFIQTKHPHMDVVIIRENEEDLYTGIEYRQSPDMCTATKMISYSGCEKIVRYAFEYAIRHSRKKISCFTKDTILKMTDGLFHQVFDEVAKEYQTIEHEHWIVDVGAAKLADTPEDFDVIVLPNLYGDILSDIAAQIAGSVGLVGSANIGDHGAMFEAIHGSAPRRAGQNLANPSALLLSSVMMLVHVGCKEVATTIHNAWLKTLEAGIHTYDIHYEGTSEQKVGTKEFADAVIAHLGQQPGKLKPVAYKASAEKALPPPEEKSKKSKQTFVGIDVYIFSSLPSTDVAEALSKQKFNSFELTLITNRGTKIYPDGPQETVCTDQYRLRFMHDGPCTQEDVLTLMTYLLKEEWEVIRTEHLYTFDGKPGYSNSK